jgi:hypothetical protein
LHRLRSVLERREYSFRVGEEYAPGFGKYGSAPPSFEQGYPQLILKKLDAPRNRRLRAVELAGRARHAAKLGNRDESLQVMQVHRPSEKLM